MKYRDQRILVAINMILNGTCDYGVKFCRQSAQNHSIYLELEILLAIKYLIRWKHNKIKNLPDTILGLGRLGLIQVGENGTFNAHTEKVTISFHPINDFYRENSVNEIIISVFCQKSDENNKPWDFIVQGRISGANHLHFITSPMHIYVDV